MKLDARFINLIYKVAEQDPPLTQEQQDIPEGALWLNEVTGKIFIALMHPEEENKVVWLSLGRQEDYLAAVLGGVPGKAASELPNAVISQFSTVNIIDVFNDGSIIAFYPFDGNANDLAHGYNGIWHGNENYAEGIFGQAAVFFEKDYEQYITLPTGLANNMEYFSISLWIKPNSSMSQSSWQQGQSILHFAMCGSCGCCGTGIGLNNRTAPYELFIHHNDTPCGRGVSVKTGYQIPGNLWTHIVFTNKGVYVNGKLIRKLDLGALAKSKIRVITIGNTYCTCYSGDPCHYSHKYAGIIDQLRIFNRVLTPEEILILYNENYLITKALKLLTNKLGGKKEFIYIPGGDSITKLERNQPIDVTGKAKIFKVTNPAPQIKESDYGKELYFPDNTAIAFTWDEDLTVPFTIFIRFKFDKINNDIYAQLMGLDLGGVPSSGKFDLHVFFNKGELKVNVGSHGRELIGYPPRQGIILIPNKTYFAFITINRTQVNVAIYDERFNKHTLKYSWNASMPITQLYENKIALGAWIYTSDSGGSANRFNHFTNSGLHIQSFRILKGELSEEDMLTLVKESTEKGVLLTEYLPQVKVYDTLDQKLEVFYNFDKIDAANKKIIDLSGKGRHGILKLVNYENIQDAFVEGVFGKALNCKGIDKRVTIQRLPTNVDFMTISFWMYWEGNPYQTSFGFYEYDLYSCSTDTFGFNTGICDIYGIRGAQQKIAKKWVHICAVFPRQSTTNLASAGAELWINGEKQKLSYVSSRGSARQVITSTAYISGWGINSNQPFRGYIDQFRIYSRKLTEKEIKLLARERYYFYK